MFNNLKRFWTAFFSALQGAWNVAYQKAEESDAQSFRDVLKENFLSVLVTKLNNLVNIESTYTVESDSTIAELIVSLCKDLESKRYDITSEMLGTGECWVFPSHNNIGELYHRIVRAENVRILNTDGENVTDVIAVIDEYINKNKRVYLLNRRQTLTGENLVIEIYVTDENNNRTSLTEWDDICGKWLFRNARHIGAGRFKSPIYSRDKASVYGQPLNHGCESIEQKIFNDLTMIEQEYKRSESKIFADPLLLKKKDNGYDIPEWIFPINRREGATASIDIFSPAIRYSAYREKLIDDLGRYEQEVGTDKGFLTPFEEGKATTATEVRRANASTIALIEKIHNSIVGGVEMTLQADAVMLNVSPDLYTVKFDFFDAFEDTDKQYERIANAVDRGTAEKIDEVQWLFPNLSLDEQNEKLARIAEERTRDTNSTIERLFETE